jgi:hypothetical protein
MGRRSWHRPRAGGGLTAVAGRAAPGADFATVAARLREILLPYSRQFAITRDEPGAMALEVRGREGQPAGYFAGIRVGKRYVSYYLMSVYAFPSELEGMSPELRRRMQGKACFNFTRVDEPLMAELAELTARGAVRWGPHGPPIPPRYV